MNKQTRRTFISLTVSALLLTAALPTARADVLDEKHPEVRAAISVQNDVTRKLMQLDSVLGTAVGLSDEGHPALVIYVDHEGTHAGQIISSLPDKMRGIPVKVELTEKFHAFGKPIRSTVSHTALQTFPIQLGTSGGWRYDLANGYCCGGTLGSLVQVNGVQYILSNYHVFESDIVLGGNSIIATTGNPIIQPGLIDVSCNANNADQVASLVKLGSLPNYNVDVGLAQVANGAVRTDGSILEIGALSSQTVGASLSQPVKKSGRTTGLTHSKISGLNATISVTYENECAGGTAFTKTFTGQIVISNNNKSFLNAGDSGSLMVEDVTTNPRAVGLLYAGGSSTAIANPINEVLSFIGSQLGGTATMVGK